MHKFRLTIGTRLMWHGEPHTITAFRGGCIELRDPHGALALTDLVSVQDSLGFEILNDEADDGKTSFKPVFDDSFEPHVITRAKKLERDLLEVLTGFPDGIATEEHPVPQAEYDTHLTSLTERIQSKASELNIDERTLWTYREHYTAQGLYGLIDGRLTRRPTPPDAATTWLEKQVLQLLKKQAGLSTRPKKKLLLDLKSLLENAKSPTEIPSDSTLYRLIERVGKQHGLLGSATQRETRANQRYRPYGRFSATRPGEVVILDTTTLDFFAFDPITGKYVRLEMSLALDLYTRSIVAHRFKSVTKDVDIAMLLVDVLRPKPVGSEWSKDAKRVYVGVPDELFVCLGSSDETAANQPAIYPETVLIDHGKVYESNAFFSVCRTLGINLQFARLGSPTDKSPLERVFGIIRQNFLSLLRGYTGPDIASRGKDTEKETFYLINEIEEMFGEWVATYWQRRVHGGLHLPDQLEMKLSPNEMYAEGLARAGFVYCVPNPSVYFNCLPVSGNAINHDGIHLFGLIFDSAALNLYRNVKSSYGGTLNGKYPIRYDRRDLSRVYFYDDTTDKWAVIPWHGALRNPRPFNDTTLNYVKALVRQRLERPAKPREIEDQLGSLLRRWERVEWASPHERSLLYRQSAQAVHVERDRAHISAALVAPNDPADLGMIDADLPDEDLDDLAEVEAQPEALKGEDSYRSQYRRT